VKNLETVRKHLKLSQKALSEASGVPQQTISAIETGQLKNPGIKTLRRLAATLDSNVDDIFPDDDGGDEE
jgi:transcriptional regulator with XRE-family HTH domain